MFGYVRPLKGEMKVREFEQFKAAYCGLCHALRRRYGFVTSWTLSYELTFLALLFEQGEPEYCWRRCAASPLRKKCTCAAGEALERAADLSVILTWYKLRDSVGDEGFFRALGARVAGLFWRRPHRRAAARLPEIDALICRRLTELAALEDAACDSLDRTADCFAGLLAALAEGQPEQRTLEQLLYHLGRWIYVIDALDDLGEDCARDRYNPIRARFALTGPALDDGSREQLETTLAHSEGLMRAAFELLPRSVYTPQVENVLYLGLPYVRARVSDGTWHKRQDRRPK